MIAEPWFVQQSRIIAYIPGTGKEPHSYIDKSASIYKVGDHYNDWSLEVFRL